MTSQEIIDSQIHSWGEKELYPVSKEEFRTLLEAGGEIEFIDRSNEDGTFFSQLKIQNKHFCHSGRDKIDGRP